MIKSITWDKQAIDYFSEAIRYIRKDSPQNANKVRQQILKKIKLLASQPEIHAPDKYKLNNTGHYRAFEVYRFRISYLIKEDEIVITRIRHSRQKPLYY